MREESNKSPTPEEQVQSAVSEEVLSQPTEEEQPETSQLEDEKAQKEALNCCGVSIPVE
jgi:hypothetical protein